MLNVAHHDDERCNTNFPVRDNKVLLYCIVLYCIVLYQSFENIRNYFCPFTGTAHNSGTDGTAPLSTIDGPPSHTSPADTMLMKDINLEYLDKLNILLVPPRTGVHNWTVIASSHGVNLDKIKYLEHCRREDSLTAMLQLPQFSNYTVGEFKEDVQRFERRDALGVISK